MRERNGAGQMGPSDVTKEERKQEFTLDYEKKIDDISDEELADFLYRSMAHADNETLNDFEKWIDDDLARMSIQVEDRATITEKINKLSPESIRQFLKDLPQRYNNWDMAAVEADIPKKG